MPSPIVTGRSIFDIVLMDVADLGSVRAGLAAIDGSVDALVMNAGVIGPKTMDLTADGVTTAFATNVLGHSRLYSEFTVFTRARSIGRPIVRSFTMATRSKGGFVKIGRHDASHRYVGFPAYFYVSPASVRLLATNATPARFEAIVAPLAAGLRQQGDATGCAFGS